MPIISIQLVTSAVDEMSNGNVQRLANELGALFGSDPGETWIRVTYLPRTHYAENDAIVGPAIKPTFVEVLKSSLQDQDSLANEAELITNIVAAGLSRPKENTHVLYLPAGINRMAFGGNLVRAENTPSRD